MTVEATEPGPDAQPAPQCHACPEVQQLRQCNHCGRMTCASHRGRNAEGYDNVKDQKGFACGVCLSAGLAWPHTSVSPVPAFLAALDRNIQPINAVLNRDIAPTLLHLRENLVGDIRDQILKQVADDTAPKIINLTAEKAQLLVNSTLLEASRRFDERVDKLVKAIIVVGVSVAVVNFVGILAAVMLIRTVR